MSVGWLYLMLLGCWMFGYSAGDDGDFWRWMGIGAGVDLMVCAVYVALR